MASVTPVASEKRQAWIEPQERMPAVGREVLCRLQHADTRDTLEHRLKHVAESDCDWRLADGGEVSYDWSVIEWQDD
ncbi:hypothetical protein D3C71_19540 [compost metagenome]